MKLILFVAMISMTTLVNAQSEYKSGLALKSGLNFARIKTSGSSGRMGVHAGGYYFTMFSRTFGMEIETSLSQVGGEFYNEHHSETENYQLTYITLPLSMRLQWSWVRVNAGVQAWALLHESSNGDPSDNIKPTDFAFFVAPGVEFPFGLTLQVSSVWGTVNILKDSDYSRLYTNYTVQFSVGYLIWKRKW